MSGNAGWCRTTTAKSWDVLQIYFKEYYGPTWLFAIDLGTGQVKKQRLADGHQFYLSGRALGFDGKYYIATPSRKTWSMDLFVYDPATNTLEERGEIVPGLGGEVRPLADRARRAYLRHRHAGAIRSVCISTIRNWARW